VLLEYYSGLRAYGKPLALEKTCVQNKSNLLLQHTPMQLQLCASLYKQRLFKGYNKKAQLQGPLDYKSLI
jgi:hypothetical protein